jgi:hypothetical protein
VPSWPWSYDSWMYNYPWNKCISPLTLWVRLPLGRGVHDTTLCDKVCQWLATGQWFSPGTPVSSTTKTDRHDIAEILLKVALNTIATWLTVLKTRTLIKQIKRNTVGVLWHSRMKFLKDLYLVVSAFCR